MQEGFEHLRCPMCGGELIYSEGTHDLCCATNPYESSAAGVERTGVTLHEERAGYGSEKRAHIYKVSGEGRLRQNAGGSGSIDMRHHLAPPLSHAGEREIEEKGSAGITVSSHVPDTPIEGHAEEPTVYADEVSAGAADDEQASSAPVRRHGCVFAVSFTESARFGTLWSVRVVHGKTNYFALMRLMQKIEKRRAKGEPLAANSPHPPKKRERTRAGKIAFRYGIEEEDVYSIKFSSETVKRLAVFYGIPERDVRRIRDEEIGEE